MKVFTERGIAVGFAILFIILAVNGYLAYDAVTVIVDDGRVVAHTHEVIANLEEALGMARDAESGERGFVITGDERYLSPYRPAIASIDSEIANLVLLTDDNPLQQRRLLLVKGYVVNLKERFRHVIDARRTEGVESARSIIIDGRGFRLMDSLRTTVAQMRATEESLLSIRSKESEANGKRALATLMIASGLALALVVAVFLLLNRNVAIRRERLATLRASNDELEHRVKERTAELTQLNATLNEEIDARRRTQEQLQEFTVELERSNRELQDFAFVASHDLQEPLRKIQAFGDRLKRKYAGAWEPEAADYMDRMQNAALRMQTLINDLLTFSRVSSKAQPFVPVSLTNVVNDVLSDLEIRIQQTGGHVDVSPMPLIEADALQMRQLFQNLIGNSLKFHRNGVPPRVDVHASIAPADRSGEGIEMCEIEISDNGIGFEERYLEKIFTPFQRLHSRSEYEGTGMGLAVCRKIAERHGGSITARSTPGQGTTFLVRLPVRHRTSTPKQEAANENG